MGRRKIYENEELITLCIRMPASLRDKVEKRARSDRRSLSQVIVLLLEERFAQIASDEGEENYNLSTDAEN